MNEKENEVMTEELETVETERKEKRNLKQWFKDNWKSVFKVGAITSAITGLAIFVKKFTSSDEYIDADYEEVESNDEVEKEET